jgi:glycosyltransferase involved in cell wall biosynthesis
MQPLVSIGIPTYNRPHGLRKALECITAQTYKNIEIIISDNGSPTNEVEQIVEEFKKKDNRIQFYKQAKNMGPFFNFRFVLDKASADYFMWAADDDSRAPDCVEFYVNNIGKANAFFSTYAIINSKNNEFIVGEEIPLLGGINNKKDLKAFMEKLCPSMIYGLFVRTKLQELHKDMGFDWSDCFFLIKFISKFGFRTTIDTPRYYAGINGINYVAKPANGKYLNPWKYFFKSLRFIIPLGYTSLKKHYNMCANAWRNRNVLSSKIMLD